MKPALTVFVAMVGIAFFAAPLAIEAQPVLEQFRVNPDRLYLRDAFRWEFSYRGLPGGLAAAKAVEIWARWEGPGEQSIRSLLTPARFHEHAADQGRFESHTLHFGAPRKAPGEIRSTLRIVLTDGREVTSGTSVRYVDTCPPPPVHMTLAAGPTGRIGLQTTTPSGSEFLQGIRHTTATLIWGDLELTRDGLAGVRPSCWCTAPAG